MSGAPSGSASPGGGEGPSGVTVSRAMRPFKFLFYASSLGLVLFAGIWAVLGMTSAQLFESPILRGIMGALGAGAFLMAVFICPLALIAALVGSVFAFLRARSSS